MEKVLIAGDFNARIGSWQINKEGEADESRATKDEIVNSESLKWDYKGRLRGETNIYKRRAR